VAKETTVKQLACSGFVPVFSAPSYRSVQRIKFAENERKHDMPDQPTPPASGTPPPNNKPPRTRGVLNKDQLADLNKAGNVVRAAQKEGRPAALAERDITDADIKALDDAVKAATTKAGAAVDNTAGKQQATAAETGAQNTLIAAIADVQKAAKQKYVGDKPALAAYYVGQDLRRNRPLLETASQAILDKLATDKLPGIKDAQIAALTAARQAYVQADAAQAGEQSDATTARKELEAMLADILKKRMAIQYAADAVWPHTTPTNAGIRREFELPADRPMK
jgi:hypothetical protein